jgi:hypothetical protein
MLPNEINPLWHIRVDHENPDQHVEFITNRQGNTQTLQRLWSLITGNAVTN